MEYLQDLEVRLELAQLQQQLYGELSLNVRQLKRQRQLLTESPGLSPQSAGPMPVDSLEQLEEALDRLAHGALLSLTEMFTDYADPYGLHESKLLLLWASGSYVRMNFIGIHLLIFSFY